MDAETARTRLLETAYALFNERGIQAVGMDEIRSASGVSLKRLYQLFPSKDELVEAVLRRRDEDVRASVTARVEAHEDPEERILAVFDFLDAWFRQPDFRGCTFINTFGELGGVAGPVGDIARAHKQDLRDLFTALVAAAGRPRELAGQLTILANGAMATAGIEGSPTPARQARSAARTLLAATRPAPARTT
ncbi:TetR/AcrR family transcriptional regulator [Bailinhaonella thermotolerans]|uniref:TetR/AcrR family transcriptional regulator n=1 Tax=Bailinhaonella thermotolerans TaxID=1070861 RepID=A0A3A4AS02_9ACTN|nr:TetR/AcrR family transcriptional regulator [Bailinhaonella thermotolerans]RJL31961.1 TetR/AcrR family transcriptional regulator [Bailinhaonella thermotolerans]